MPTIRAAEFEGFLTGDAKPPEKTISNKSKDVLLHNLAYSQWVARDHAVLDYLLSRPDIFVFDK
jgi:hypothetical protein